MQAEGFESLYSMERLAVMGLVEPLGRLPELLRIRRRLRDRWSDAPPALFLGIDAPDFNLDLARSLSRRGLSTAQLVSPTVWAWRPRRVFKVANAVDTLLCLFPFEPPMYAGLNLAAHYVGHPLATELKYAADRCSVRRDLGIDTKATVIALMPGSRGSELAQLGDVFLSAGRLLLSRDERRVLLLPAANAERLEECRALLQRQNLDGQVQLLMGQSREAMIAADVVVLASGTASLEAMLLRRPMVIAYRVAPVSWALMSRLAVTPYVGLPNILAGCPVVPELLQGALSAPALALHAETLLREGQAQVDALAEARQSLVRDFDAAVVDALSPFFLDEKRPP